MLWSKVGVVSPNYRACDHRILASFIDPFLCPEQDHKILYLLNLELCIE